MKPSSSISIALVLLLALVGFFSHCDATGRGLLYRRLCPMYVEGGDGCPDDPLPRPVVRPPPPPPAVVVVPTPNPPPPPPAWRPPYNPDCPRPRPGFPRMQCP
ncbi:OLC1v1026498C1 [Oldenlandia corymbosa var. corymbosa]|uniref:OLC1v1026498C1 n=1 Tax=Oldenlandia corymbosa var. corymbosa TaxID=529605 RepID=A0AAV1C785_OLDCO|nr:OLC1v1026498C1 [Oldenlandia corymbosa var. corymbosa]